MQGAWQGSIGNSLQVVRMDETTKAPTLLCTIVTDRGVSWEQAREMLEPGMPAFHPANQNAVVDLEAPEPIGNLIC